MHGYDLMVTLECFNGLLATYWLGFGYRLATNKKGPLL